MKYETSCGIIPVYKNKVLLVKGWHNHWWWPKWHIEKWETCLQAAKREFTEETGIPSDFLSIKKDLVFEDKYFFTLDWEKILKKVKYFVGILKDGFDKYLKPQEGEIYEIWLFTYEEALQKFEYENMKNILKEVKTLTLF